MASITMTRGVLDYGRGTRFESTSLVHFGPFELDLSSRELKRGTICVRLQTQPFEILQMLLERRGEVVTRAELRNRLWPSGTFVDFDHSLNAAIKRLRVALGDSADNPRYIETLPRRGYRFKKEATSDASGHAMGAERVRLAVLPFVDLGEDERGYFSDGLTEETISQLGCLPSHIGVISLNSSMVFKGRSAPTREIGRSLRADYLLEGSVRRLGDRVRVSARLVDTSSETHLWMKTYERTMSDSLSVQTDVACEIARSLTVEFKRASGTSPRPGQSYEDVTDTYGRDTSLKSCRTLKAASALSCKSGIHAEQSSLCHLRGADSRR
jgi:TolB-like protein